MEKGMEGWEDGRMEGRWKGGWVEDGRVGGRNAHLTLIWLNAIGAITALIYGVEVRKNGIKITGFGIRLLL